MRHDAPTPPGMRRAYGADAVLVRALTPEGQGDLGTDLRRSYEARRRRERRRGS